MLAPSALDPNYLTRYVFTITYVGVNMYDTDYTTDYTRTSMIPFISSSKKKVYWLYNLANMHNTDYIIK